MRKTDTFVLRETRPLEILIVTDNHHVESAFINSFSDSFSRVVPVSHTGEAFYELAGGVPRILVVDAGSSRINAPDVIKFAQLQQAQHGTTFTTIVVDDPLSFLQP